MSARPQPVVTVRLKLSGVALLALTFVQLYFGALVAGLRAGRVYNTWPEIDGAFIPSAARLWFEEPWWRNLFDNTLTVQFEHRMTAYALLILAVLARHRRRAVAGRQRPLSAARGRWWPRSRCRLRSASSRCCIRCRSIWRWRIRLSAIVVLTLRGFADRTPGRAPCRARSGRNWFCRSGSPAEIEQF